MQKNILFTLTAVLTFFPLSCQEDIDARLQREADEYTQKHCPQFIEKGNVLDSVKYKKSVHTYSRYYTFSGYLDTTEAHQAASSNLNLLKSHLIAQLRTETDWKTCQQHGIIFEYIYISAQSHTPIFTIRIFPQDYGDGK